MAGKRIAVLSLFALVALALTVFASSGTEAGTYKARTTYQIVNPVADAASSNILYVTIPAPDYNYEDSSMYNFAPVGGWIAMGSSIPIGAGMGSLSSQSTLGLFNGKCSSPVSPFFPLYNATVDTSKVIAKELMAWTNTARPISYRYMCSNNTDDDGDTKINDGCPKEASNDDAPDDTVINDGCPTVAGVAETLCTDDVDNDNDGTTNDGCPTIASTSEGDTAGWCDPDAGEATCGEAPNACADGDGFPPWDLCDNDSDGMINDGCAKLAKDDDTTDTAEDTAGRRVNDGCPAVGATEKPGGCADDLDNDGDTTVNDGCDKVGTIAESGTQCIDAEVSSDITLPDFVEYYPYFLNSMLDPPDPDGAGPLPDPLPLKPRARYAGSAVVAGSNMLIETIVLSPGQIAQLPSIKALMAAQLGPVLITALNNPWDQVENPGSVSDFCSPMASITTLLGTTTDNPSTAVNEAGYVSQKNAGATSGVLGTGTYISRNYSMSERDIDGDGFENDLDPCHYTLDPLWNPRVAYVHPGPGDHDVDGLPDSCDPDPQGAAPEPDPIPGTNCVGIQTDCDNDGYNNRQDICPLVANGQAVGQGNQADTDSTVVNADLGPGPDSIGDPCDDSDSDGVENAVSGCPGAGAGNCNNGLDDDADTAVDGNDTQCKPCMDSLDAAPWGASPGTGLFFHSMPMAAACIGSPAVDTDGDGYCDALEIALGSPINNGPETGAQCIDAENPSCVNAINDDAADDGTPAQGRINDGCPQKGGAPETACNDDVDDDADTRVNDGCPPVNAAENPACAEDPAVDSDGDTKINDGCPAKDAPEDRCASNVDDDGDTNINDGCPQKGMAPEDPSCVNDTDDDAVDDGQPAGTFINDGCPIKGAAAETDCGVVGTPETLPLDDDADTRVNDGCAAVNTAENPECADDIDNDGDTLVNDGCPAKDAAETPLCDDDVDDDADTNVNDGCPTFGTNDDVSATDTVVNDGCPMKGAYAEVGAECANNTSDDTCTPDTSEASLLYGPFVNDGCPAIGVPESLVIDAPTMNVPAALPSALPPSSCSDGVDNDGDTTIDTDTGTLACNSGDSSYTGDADLDGKLNADDNCGNTCLNNTDDDGDTRVNDGCAPSGAVETICNETSCPDADDTPNAPPWATCDNDADTLINDGCAIWPTAGGVAEVSSHIWNPEQTNTDKALSLAGAQLPVPTALRTDSAGDACDGDDDNDGFTDVIEWYVGTDPLDNCSNWQGSPVTKSDAWPLDMNQDTFVTMADVFMFAGNINLQISVNPPTNWPMARKDLNRDDFITMADVFLYSGKINQQCA